MQRLALWMDVQWVLQSRELKFDGFFIEFLGIASRFTQDFPMARLVKSSFSASLDEGPVSKNSKLLDLLFVEERLVIEYLISPAFPIHKMSNYLQPQSMFTNEVSCPDCCDSVTEFQDARLDGDLARYAYPASSALICCQACISIAHCLSWTYSSISQECHIKGSSVHMIQPNAHSGTGGQMISAGKTRFPKPRAIILPGTTCIWMNETLSNKRSIDNIFIGRVMLERAQLVGGLSLDEFAVSHCIGIVDELWVPTQWHKKVFENLLTQFSRGSRPEVVVVGEAVNTSLFNPSLEPVKPNKGCRFIDNNVKCEVDHKFVFLSIFKWERRKGWDILLRAFWQTFQPSDNVLLLIHSYLPPPHGDNPNITALLEEFAQQAFGKALQELAETRWLSELLCSSHSHSQALTPQSRYWQQLLHSHNNDGNAHCMAAGLSRREIRRLYAISDAFVLPTRGEGWGLPIAEAMAMGMPVLVTNYSGPTAYITADNAYPIDVEDTLDALSYATPKEKHLMSLLRQVIIDSNTSFIPSIDCPSEDSSGQTCAVGQAVQLSIAQMQGQRARERMQEFNAELLVAVMQERLLLNAARRGWNMMPSTGKD
jgi:glycosyltransferase involved in cell wall biosynthesis